MRTVASWIGAVNPLFPGLLLRKPGCDSPSPKYHALPAPRHFQYRSRPRADADSGTYFPAETASELAADRGAAGEIETGGRRIAGDRRVFAIGAKF